MWHCWPSEPGSHTELWGRLACCLSTAEENNWWHFAHSPERYLSVTEHCSHPSNQWCHPEGFWEESWQRGVAGLRWWHSKPHCFSFKRHHWDTVDNKQPAHRTCEVICTSCSPYCAGLGVQTILSWGDKHRCGPYGILHLNVLQSREEIGTVQMFPVQPNTTPVGLYDYLICQVYGNQLQCFL